MEVAVVLSVLSLIVSVVSVIVAYLVAVKYGDMAAVKATRKFHEEDVARARVAALQSLRNEVVRIRKFGAILLGKIWWRLWCEHTQNARGCI